LIFNKKRVSKLTIYNWFQRTFEVSSDYYCSGANVADASQVKSCCL